LAERVKIRKYRESSTELSLYTRLKLLISVPRMTKCCEGFVGPDTRVILVNRNRLPCTAHLHPYEGAFIILGPADSDDFKRRYSVVQLDWYNRPIMLFRCVPGEKLLCDKGRAERSEEGTVTSECQHKTSYGGTTHGYVEEKNGALKNINGLGEGEHQGRAVAG
jgi:hypothetical protein